MRTTLTLDDDVAKMLQRVRQKRNTGLKEAVNDALRTALPQLLRPRPQKNKRFRIKTFRCGPPRIPLDNIAEVLEYLDGPDYH